MTDTKDNIISYLESCGLSPDEIDATLDLMEAATSQEAIPLIDSPESFVKSKIENEPDWRKRASLVASLISKNYE